MQHIVWLNTEMLPYVLEDDILHICLFADNSTKYQYFKRVQEKSDYKGNRIKRMPS